MTEESEKPRTLPHILSGIELQMDLELDDMAKEGFKPEGDTIAEGPLKPSPFDAGGYLISFPTLTISALPIPAACTIAKGCLYTQSVYSGRHMKSARSFAAKLDPFSSESEDEYSLHRPGGIRTQRTRSEADKTLAHKRLDAQKVHKEFEPSESLADDDDIPFDPAGHHATRTSTSRPPRSV